MGSLGVPEIAFIFVLALLIFGPKRLPEIGRTVGKGLAEFRKASNDLKRTINAELALEETPKPSTPVTRRVPAGTIAAPLATLVAAAASVSSEEKAETTERAEMSQPEPAAPAPHPEDDLPLSS